MRSGLLATVAVIAIAAGGGYYAYSTNPDVKAWVDTSLGSTPADAPQAQTAAEGQNRELPPPPPSAASRTMPAPPAGQVAEIPQTLADVVPVPPPATGPSAELDIDALIARLPADVQAAYAAKSYDPSTGVTTIEGLTFTFADTSAMPVLPMVPEFAPMPDAPQEMAPEMPAAPEETSPPAPQDMNFVPGAQAPGVTPINLAPPFPEPEQAEQVSGPEQIVIAKIESRGLDVAAFEKVFDAANYGETRDPSFLRLVDQATLTGVSFIADGQTLATIETVELRGMEMKQFDFVPGGENFDAQFVNSEFAPLQMMGTILDSLKLSLLSVRGLTVDTGNAEAGDDLFLYKWDAYEFSGIDRGRMGPVLTRNVVNRMQDPTLGMMLDVSVAESYADGADFSGVLPYLIKAEMPPVTARDLISFGRSTVSGMRYAMAGMFSLDIASGSSEPMRFTWLVPSDVVMQLDGKLTLDQNAPDMKDVIEMAGQSEFPFSFALDWKYDDAAGNMILNRLFTSMGGLYGVDLGFSIGGLPLEKLADMAALETIDQSLVLNGLSVKLIDEGGTEKSMNIFAKESGMTLAQAREMMKGQVSMLTIGPDGQPAPALKAIADALVAFIDNPGVLTFAIAPAAPILLSELGTVAEGGDPAAIVDKLGLTATAGPK